MLNRSRCVILRRVVLATLTLGVLAGLTGAQTKAVKGDAYPLGVCVVSGEKLGSMGDPVLYSHQGREMRFCCKNCVRKFKADPARYLAKLDAAIVKQQRPYYPLTTCVVLGDPLTGEDSDPVDHVYKNRLVRFCCKKCIRKFEKNPGKYLKALDEAVIQAQKGKYPLRTCVVSGQKLGHMGKPFDYIHANRLVRFCCKGCVKKFRKNPAKFLAKLGKAPVARLAGDGHREHKHQEHEHQEHKH